MITQLDLLCHDLAAAATRWEQQAQHQSAEAEAYRCRGNVQAETFNVASAEVRVALAETLRRLIDEYSPKPNSPDRAPLI